ncbi:MAG: hypothetical protein JWL95_1682, partial [Gemmatimonadetes bacterium]|nr:hypothetical protein [Gemmatimonadota bacterium]
MSHAFRQRAFTRARAMSVGRRLSEYALVLASIAVPRASVLAQSASPWAMTIQPSMNPLPIGACAAVSLMLKDSTGKDAPRNPTGFRVSISDFDMSVSSANPLAVAGRYNGASNWSVCACQSATAGITAVITATYPAAALARNARVPGVAFQATAPFTIGRAQGASEPGSCAELKQQPIVVQPPSAAPPAQVAVAAAGPPSSAGVPRAG